MYIQNNRASMPLLKELKRRKVFRVAVTYAIVGWLLAQIADTTFPILLLPGWLLRAFVIFIILGFPIALILAWSYEITPDGITRDSDKRQDSRSSVVSSPHRYFLIGAGTLALGLLLGGFLGRSSTGLINSDGGPTATSELRRNRVSGIRLPLRLDGFMHSALPSGWGMLAISRDGRKLAYIGYYDGDQHLYIKGERDGMSRRIPGTAGASTPFFSPDGSSVGFLQDRAIRVVPAAGGKSVVVAEPVPMIMGAAWGENDNIVFTDGFRAPLKQVSSAGGPISQLTTLGEKEASHRNPEFVPNTNVLLFESASAGREIWAYNFETGERELLADGGLPKFSAGSVIFRRTSGNSVSLWSAELDPDTLSLTSKPAPLTGDVAPVFAVAASGAIIFANPPDEIRHRLLLLDSNGGQRVLSDIGRMNYPRFSPDGKYVSVSVRDNNQENVWMFSIDGQGRGTRVTSDSGQYGIWDINGNGITYLDRAVGIRHLALTTKEPAATLVAFDNFTYPLQWTDQGLLYMQVRDRTNADIFFLDRSGETSTILATQAPTPDAQIHPNGKWMAFCELENNQPTLFVRAFPDGNLRWQVSARNGDFPKWSGDGSTLFYVSHNQILSVAVSESAGKLSFSEPPKLVHEFGGAAGVTFDPFDISPDGNTIAVIDATYSNPPSQVYVSDWKDLLPVMAPVN